MLAERHIRIINSILKASQPVKIQELARAENVSVQTIYSDLHQIEKISFSGNRGEIAVTFSEDGSSIVSQKILSNRVMREKACEYVIENILNGNPRGVLYIDGGSTGYLFFEALRKRNIQDVVILTNNPLILGSFAEDERFFYQNSVFAIGGKLDPLRMSLYSVAHHDDFDLMKGEDYQIDICVPGFRGISAKGDLYIDNEEEVNQKRNLIAKSRRMILILPPEKLEATGLFKITALSKEMKKPKKQIDIIVASDKTLDDEAAETLREIGRILGESSVKILT